MLDEVVEVMGMRTKNQIPLFSEADGAFPDLDIIPYSKEQKLEHELELLGVYITGHPMEQYETIENKYPLNALISVNHAQKVRIAGLVNEVKVINTKKGEQMAFCMIEDQTGRTEVVFFPKIYTACKALLKKNSPL